MKRPKHASKATYHPQAFGGWGDYQTWADHDFLPKPPDAEEPEAPEPEPDPEPEPEPEPVEASADSPDFEAEPAQYLDPPTLPDAYDPGDFDGFPEAAPKARPYVRTGGRTRASHDLRLETLLSAGSMPAGVGDANQRALRELCRSPISVAEIAARFGVPLGVARVLISDAITARHLHVHEPAIGRDGEPPMDLLHRVVAGLRNLR